MALKVNRTFKGETSSVDEAKEEVWHYDVHADDLTFTITEAKYANDGVTRIPPYGSVHPTDDEMTCANIASAREEQRPTLIRVTVTWRSPKAGEGSVTVPEGQTKIWAIELGFDREAYTELRNRDTDKKPIKNSAGDIYEPIEMKGTDAVYLYSYFVKNLNWDAMGEAHGCVNDNTVVLKFNGREKSFEKHTLMIEPRFSVVDKIEKTSNTVTTTDFIYKVECRLTHKKSGWMPKLIDQGWNYLDERDGLVEAVDKHGQKVLSPVLLDGDGGLLDEGAEVVLMPKGDDGGPSPGFKMVYETNFTSLPGFGG